jgi:hypothetical protein
VLVWRNHVRKVYILGQPGSVQHAWTSTAPSVPCCDLRSCHHRQDRRRSCRRRSLQWPGQWRAAGRGCGDAGDAGNAEDGVAAAAGVEAGRWAGQRRQRVDALLSLDSDAR